MVIRKYATVNKQRTVPNTKPVDFLFLCIEKAVPADRIASTTRALTAKGFPKGMKTMTLG